MAGVLLPSVGLRETPQAVGEAVAQMCLQVDHALPLVTRVICLFEPHTRIIPRHT